VGFYSAFIVADEVVVRTRKAGEPAANGVEWRSAGKGEFTVTPIERTARGTEIVLHLKEDAVEFANDWQLRSIIKRYSDHIDVPVMMPAPRTEAEQNAEAEEGAERPAGDADAPTFERVNDGQALWLKSKNELSDEDYQGFYKQFTHDFDDPMSWVHSQVEGKLEYSSLFFIPKNAPFDLWDRDARRGVKLYVQRVFIMEDEEQILPRYLRFVRGLVDTNDLPLNVSREILQRNRVIDSISTASVKKVLGMIEGLAKDEAQYRPFWSAFGRVLKEGLVEDASNRERLTALMRMHSTSEAAGEDAHETVSFEAYRSRMPESQKSIYYLLGDDLKAVRNSPLLEVFKQRGFEVLLLTDPVDEWWVNHVTEIDGVPLKSISQGELDFEIATESGAQTKLDEGFSGRLAEALGARVSEVRASARLTDSPACLVTAEGGMTRQLEQMLRAAGQEVPEQKPVLEINPNHPIVRQLEGEQNAERFADTACLLFDQAVIADGGRVEDPGEFVRRLNDVLLKVALVS
jgi:molecular chaperone HtpG